ncbi:MAG TPA: hypothetical protein VFB43_08985 [Terracidiphilus sp.]|nr:hypothetical protein [Terracidiphilus sp.]
MRTSRFFCLMGLTASLATPTLMAQGTIVSSINAGPIGVTGMPYTATLKTTVVRTLANGTKITHETTMKEARDSNGRTYRERHHESLPAGADGADFVTVNIFDPVNRVSIMWNADSKQATIFHMPEPEQIRSAAGQTPKVQTRVRSRQNTPDSAPQFERLGTQTINGVVAEGIRVTRIIPAGKQGNDQPITITNETWRSNELKLLVRSINDDPLTGVTTTELTNFEQGEPDPALFQVPEGYTVKEQFPQTQNQ